VVVSAIPWAGGGFFFFLPWWGHSKEGKDVRPGQPRKRLGLFFFFFFFSFLVGLKLCYRLISEIISAQSFQGLKQWFLFFFRSG